MIIFLAVFITGFALIAEAATTPPAAPVTYTAPPGAVRVNDGAALAAELSRKTPRIIVLADGVYTNGGYFDNRYGYAEHLGKAVLAVGLAIGSNYMAIARPFVASLST